MGIAAFLNMINFKNFKFKIIPHPGISINELHEIEQKLGVQLPADLVDFYSLSNGLEGNDDWAFNIIPLNEIEKDADDTGDYLLFAEYLIYSETCGLEIDPHDHNKYKLFTLLPNPEDPEKSKRNYKANSIADFITLFCNKGTFGIFNDEEYSSKVETSGFPVRKKWWKFW